MRAVHFCLISVIGLALLATGMLPPEHLHRPTVAHPQLVHAHLDWVPAGASGAPARAAASHAEDDDHERAIGIEHVIAAGPRVRSVGALALLPARAHLSDSRAVSATLPTREPGVTGSPPRRSSPPRAPPD